MRKEMKKRVLSLMLCVLMVLGLMPVMPEVAKAETDMPTIYVAGIQVTEDNASDVLGNADAGATVIYDKTTGMLTLNNASIDTSGLDNVPALEIASGAVQLVLIGDNTLNGSNQMVSNVSGDVVLGHPAILLGSGTTLTITEESQGTLNVAGKYFSKCGVEGIYAFSAIKGEGNLVIEGGTINNIHGLNIGGDFTVTGGNIQTGFVIASNVEVTGGELTASGSVDGLYDDSITCGIHGIYGENSISITGGELHAWAKAGVVSDSYVGELMVTGVLAPMHGICSDGIISISGDAKVSTSGSKAGYRINDLGHTEYVGNEIGGVDAGAIMKAQKVEITGGKIHGTRYSNSSVTTPKIIDATEVYISEDIRARGDLQNDNTECTYETYDFDTSNRYKGFKSERISSKVERTYGSGQDLYVKYGIKDTALQTVSTENRSLQEGIDYELSNGGDGIVIKASYLDALSVGQYTFELTFVTDPGSNHYNQFLDYKIVLNVEKAPLTIAAVSTLITEKDYDGKAEIELSDITLNGIRDGEVVGLDISKLTAKLPSTDAGEYLKVILSGEIVLTGQDAANYTMGPVSGEYLLTDRVIVNKIDPEFTNHIINKRYVYAVDSLESIDLTEFLPEDCGPYAISQPVVTGDIALSEEDVVIEDDTLVYTVPKGDIGDKGEISFVLSSTNYTEVYITIDVELIDKYEVIPASDVTLKSNMLYVGETLSKLEFNPVKFMANGQEIEGTLAWQNPTLVPEKGTTSATWVFTPADTNQYQTLTGTIAIGVYDGPYIEGDDDKQGWDVIRDAIAEAKEGDTIKVDMNGT
ncbi:MAG: hypothetical protein IJ958_07165, partial [Agathobacter sp.]|nr:hypothetical protein [Agathobacter sp.]